MKGTLLNTATVAGGAIVGLAIGKVLPESYETIALGGLGLVVLGIGLKMFLESKNIIVVAGAIALGGVIGTALHFPEGIAAFAEWARTVFGGEASKFNEGLITTSILYCVGPMTLLGCLQDGLEGKTEILALKSTLDGITAIFFAATLGAGVLVTALVVLVVQGGLTLLARPLRGVREHPESLNEAAAAGGVIIMMIGLGLSDIKKMPTAAFIPSLVIAPLFISGGKALRKLRKPKVEEPSSMPAG